MRSLRLAPFLVFVGIGATGCASIIGLDSGKPMDDDGGTATSAAGDRTADDDGAAPVADTGTPPGPAACAADTADCNGQASDGCEADLNSTFDCGGCGHACSGAQICNAGNCCLAAHAACTTDEECCSGACGPGKSGCH